MDGEIKVQKTTSYLLFGLVMVFLVSGYMVFGAASVPGGAKNPVANDQTPQSLSGTTQQSGGQIQQNNSSQQIQEVYIKALSDGSYDKTQVTVNVNVLVRIHFTTDGNVGCGAVLRVYGLNLQTSSKNGQEGIIEFTPTQTGTYEYSCGMRMWGPGELIVQ